MICFLIVEFILWFLFKVHGMDDDREVIGQMNVTVSIVQALQKAQQREQNNHRMQT
jgi:hypothetical protein